MSGLRPHDLVCCTGTVRGVPFEVKARAAAAAGFDAISIRPAEVDELVASGVPRASVRGWLADLGLGVAELDPLMTWLPAAPEVPGMHSADVVLAMARDLRPDCVSVLVPLDVELDLAAATEAFASLCDRAATDGTRLAIEFFAWSPLCTLADAWTIARDADRPNGGLVIDVWHHARRGGTVADLDAVDPTRVWAVQLSDAPATPVVDDLAAECRDHRLWPGEGVLPVAETVTALRNGGCRAPLAMEVFGSVADEDEARTRLQRAREALVAVEDPLRALRETPEMRRNRP